MLLHSNEDLNDLIHRCISNSPQRVESAPEMLVRFFSPLTSATVTQCMRWSGWYLGADTDTLELYAASVMTAPRLVVIKALGPVELTALSCSMDETKDSPVFSQHCEAVVSLPLPSACSPYPSNTASTSCPAHHEDFRLTTYAQQVKPSFQYSWIYPNHLELLN